MPAPDHDQVVLLVGRGQRRGREAAVAHVVAGQVRAFVAAAQAGERGRVVAGRLLRRRLPARAARRGGAKAPPTAMATPLRKSRRRMRRTQYQPIGDSFRLMWTCFTWRYSSAPQGPSSRPIPLIL